MAVERTIKQLPHSEVEIDVTIPWAEWSDFITQAVEELGKGVKIEGFRPGKAPKRMVEEKVGLGTILERAAEKAIQKTHAQIIEAEKLDFIGSPKAEILKIAEGSELQYRIQVAVMPVIELKPWEALVKQVNEKFKKEEVAVLDKDIEEELKKLANSRAKLVTVNRPAAIGDSVIIDFDVSIDGVPIEHGSARKHPMVLGRGMFIPGFEEQLVGMKELEEKTFQLTFPEAYHEKGLANRAADFKVTVHVVQERLVPNIDDAFAVSLGKFESLEALQQNMREGMLEEKKHEQHSRQQNEIVKALVAQAEADLPHVLVHHELHKMIDELSHQVQSMGMNLDDYLVSMQKTKDELEKAWEPQAIDRVKAAMVLEKIALDKSITVEGNLIEEEMNKTLQYYRDAKVAEKDIDLQRLYAYTKGMMTNQKVFEYLEKI